MPDKHTDELKKLREENAFLRDANERLRAENAELSDQLNQLSSRLDYFIKKYFGKSSEKLDPNQLELLLEGLSTSDSAQACDEDERVKAANLLADNREVKKKRPPRSRKDRFPANCPVEEKVIVPLTVQADPDAYRKIGEEVSVQYDYQPGKIIEQRTIRPKYVEIADKNVPPLIAPLPPKLQERGMLSPGFLTHIVIGKYADHLPLYRQQSILRTRHDVHLSRATLCNAVDLVAFWLKPIVEEISAQQFTRGYVQIDETFIKYLKPGSGKAQQGYLWLVHTPGGDTVYHWYKGRGHDSLEDFIPGEYMDAEVLHDDDRGHVEIATDPRAETAVIAPQLTVQCDGHSAYTAFSKKYEAVTLLGCWTHVRRYFHEAFEGNDHPLRTSWVLKQIGQLYRIEKRLRESRAGPALREATRQSESKMIIRRLHRVLTQWSESGRHMPKSLLGKAINYALNRWDMLEVYLTDGRLEICNNLIENRVRPTAIGKKNYLFFGSEEAGERSAIIYSIVTSCHNHGIDPFEYMKDVLERLPAMMRHEIPTITPAAWAAARRAGTTAAMQTSAAS